MRSEIGSRQAAANNRPAACAPQTRKLRPRSKIDRGVGYIPQLQQQKSDFHVELAQNVLDVLGDSAPLCAKNHANLVIPFASRDLSAHLGFAFGESE